MIEMMMVVAIIGVLAAIAYPSYLDQIRSGRRADAQSVLLQAAQYMERFYTENSRYNQNTAGTAVALPANLTQAPIDGDTKYYGIAIVGGSLSRSAYILRATPINAQVGDGFLEYTSAGNRRWDRNNNGSIGAGEGCWKKSC